MTTDKQTRAATEAFERYRVEQGQIAGMPGLKSRPSFMAGYKSGAESSAQSPTVAGLTDRIREAIDHGLAASRIDEHYNTDPIVDDIARRIIDVIGSRPAEFMTTSELEEIARENAIHAAIDRLLHSDDLMDGISAVRAMLANPPAALAAPSLPAGDGLTVPEGWKPIETAPKDRVVWAFNGEQARMKWAEGDGFALWIWDDEMLCDVEPDPPQPTHWMQLPAAPTGEGKC